MLQTLTKLRFSREALTETEKEKFKVIYHLQVPVLYFLSFMLYMVEGDIAENSMGDKNREEWESKSSYVREYLVGPNNFLVTTSIHSACGTKVYHNPLCANFMPFQYKKNQEKVRYLKYSFSLFVPFKSATIQCMTFTQCYRRCY